MAEALLALGGNVGNSRAILDRAIGLLSTVFRQPRDRGRNNPQPL